MTWKNLVLLLAVVISVWQGHLVVADLRRTLTCQRLAPNPSNCADVSTQIETIVRHGNLADFRWACEYGTCDLGNRLYILNICKSLDKTDIMEYIENAV